ncbi:MAG TPA: cache domain-containing protein [Chitinispirillaceae bacterium]|nr:cache domain-containing protein [Chitinispirillaceae bacterium]
MKATIPGLLAIAFLTLTVTAQESEKDIAVKMVTSAVSFIKSNGTDAGIKALSDSNGQFVKGELYVFAYDTTGTIVAHPKNPKLIGKNLTSVPDVDGKMFRKELVETALSKKTGWVDYKYKNHESGKIEDKTTYVALAGALILGCGMYK